jgi:hypothetical protein
LPASGFSLVWWGLDLALVQNKTLAQVRRSLDAIQALHHEMGHHFADRYTEAALAIAKKLLTLGGGGGPGIPKPRATPCDVEQQESLAAMAR